MGIITGQQRGLRGHMQCKNCFSTMNFKYRVLFLSILQFQKSFINNSKGQDTSFELILVKLLHQTIHGIDVMSVVTLYVMAIDMIISTCKLKEP